MHFGIAEPPIHVLDCWRERLSWCIHVCGCLDVEGDVLTVDGDQYSGVLCAGRGEVFSQG